MKRKQIIILLLVIAIISGITLIFHVKDLSFQNIYVYKIRNRINSLVTINKLDKIFITPQKGELFNNIISLFYKPSKLSFYVAGHTYGSHHVEPEIRAYMHPPFVEVLPKIAKSKTIDFGVLTGDVVYIPQKANIKNAKDAMATTQKTYYIAPGNHDLGIENDFIQRTDEYFVLKNNLFIILTPQYNWVLDIYQLDMIAQALERNPEVQNIFVFTHYLFWLEMDDKRFPNIEPNGFTEKEDESNFWTDVIYLFTEYENDIFFIAGDVGAHYSKTSVVYERIDNYHFIASGMGGGKKDNFMLVEIDKKGEVNFELIALNGLDYNAMGDLEDWSSVPSK